MGHVSYVFGFFYAAQTNTWTWVGGVTALVIGIGIFLWLKPHLGKMKGPVVVYMLIITTMVIGACSVFGQTRLNVNGRLMVFIGALAFYFSDIFVARDRFIKNEFLNRLIGLPMYYAGQFLLAFSVGFLV